jgi:threonine/homoserine/homoserine lactone efflux protein
MAITLLIKGIIIGFAMAVPIGPMGIMCIRKTLTEGRWPGLVIGLGAATADMFYGSVAAFGLTIISDTLISHKFWIRLIGGVFLIAYGIKTYKAKAVNPKVHKPSHGLIGSYFYSVFLTLTNPLTIFSFLAVFAAFGLGSGLNYFSASALVIGVLVGSFLWFFSLSSVVILFRNKLDMVGLQWVNRIAGLLIIICGVAAIVSII